MEIPIFGSLYFFDSELTKKEIIIFTLICKIIALLCSIPNLISIVVMLTQKDILKFQQRIQIMMCISFIGIESSFLFPFITEDEKKWLPRLQSSLSSSFSITILYLQVMYAYSAYKSFTSPQDLNKLFSKILIFVCPFVLFIFFGLYIFIQSNIMIFFNFIVFPYDKITLYFYKALILILFLVIVLFTLLLLSKIKKVLLLNGNTRYTKKKYFIYRKKLSGYIIGSIIVYHPLLVHEIICFFIRGCVWNLYFLIYFFGMKILSGIFYWYIYIYNKNLMKSFLDLFHRTNTKNYIKNNEEINCSIIEESPLETEGTRKISLSDLSGIEKDETFSIGLNSSRTHTDNIKENNLESYKDQSKEINIEIYKDNTKENDDSDSFDDDDDDF